MPCPYSEKCILCNSVKSPCIPGEGPLSSKILFVGEAPGREEDDHNRYFVGGAGRVLDSLLKDSGIQRDQVRIENSVCCRPTTNTEGHVENRAPSKKELDCCRLHLVSIINQVKPNLIVVLGATALLQVMKETGITKKRGYIFWSEEFNCKVLVTYHPAYLLPNRHPESLSTVLQDFILAKRESETSTYTIIETGCYRNILTIEEATELFERLNEVPEFSFDLETTEYDPFLAKVLNISFSWKEGTGVYFPLFEQGNDNYWGVQWEPIILPALKKVFLNNSLKIAQNGKFDLSHLWMLGIKVNNFNFDTMLAHHLIDENSKHSLDTLSGLVSMQGYKGEVQKALDMLPGKKEEKSFKDVPLETIRKYGASDSDCTLRLKHLFEPMLEKLGLSNLFNNLVMPLSKVLLKVEMRGVKIDVPLLEKKRKEYKERINKLENSMYTIVGKEFNVNSSKQLIEILYKENKLPILAYTDGGAPSTDKETLDALDRRVDNPLLKTLLEYRKLFKIHNTYLVGMKEQLRGGRIHGKFLIAGTVTGRLSSKDPNLQNIPPDVQELFIPEDGYKFIVADYSQAELRVTASYSGEPGFKRCFDEDIDIHTQTACNILKKKPEDVTKKDRKLAKSINFGILYGQQAKGLSEDLGIPYSEAERYIDAYFDQYKQLAIWIERVHAEVKSRLKVSSIFGRIRRLPEVGNQDYKVAFLALRQSVNSIVQGTSSDITSLAAINIDNHLEEIGSLSGLLLLIHDALIFEVRNEEVELLKEKIKYEMTTSMFEQLNGKLKIMPKVDMEVVDRWGKKEEVKENVEDKYE